MNEQTAGEMKHVDQAETRPSLNFEKLESNIKKSHMGKDANPACMVISSINV